MSNAETTSSQALTAPQQDPYIMVSVYEEAEGSFSDIPSAPVEDYSKEQYRPLQMVANAMGWAIRQEASHSVGFFIQDKQASGQISENPQVEGTDDLRMCSDDLLHDAPLVYAAV